MSHSIDDRLKITNELFCVDKVTGKWKLQLKTFERQQSGGWVHLGESLPEIKLTLQVHSHYLERLDDLSPRDILSTATSSRVLAGLSKKAIARLGTPVDVMTNKWLPPQDQRLVRMVDESNEARQFNPLKTLATILRDRGAGCPKYTTDEQAPVVPSPLAR